MQPAHPDCTQVPASLPAPRSNLFLASRAAGTTALNGKALTLSPGRECTAQSQLTATSASRVQAILLHQPLERLGCKHVFNKYVELQIPNPNSAEPVCLAVALGNEDNTEHGEVLKLVGRQLQGHLQHVVLQNRRHLVSKALLRDDTYG
ncbi:hypothetical protein AAY473_014750 [Plecturocebus cupreus]